MVSVGQSWRWKKKVTREATYVSDDLNERRISFLVSFVYARELLMWFTRWDPSAKEGEFGENYWEGYKVSAYFLQGWMSKFLLESSVGLFQNLIAYALKRWKYNRKYNVNIYPGIFCSFLPVGVKRAFRSPCAVLGKTMSTMGFMIVMNFLLQVG